MPGSLRGAEHRSAGQGQSPAGPATAPGGNEKSQFRYGLACAVARPVLLDQREPVTVPPGGRRAGSRWPPSWAETDGRGSQAVALRASAIGGCRACTRCMSAMREDLHHLVDLLPEAKLRPAIELIRAHAAGSVKGHQALPECRHAARYEDDRRERVSRLFWNSSSDSVRYRRADQLIRVTPLARTETTGSFDDHRDGGPLVPEIRLHQGRRSDQHMAADRDGDRAGEL